jgi:hypothetical protein
VSDSVLNQFPLHSATMHGTKQVVKQEFLFLFVANSCSHLCRYSIQFQIFLCSIHLSNLMPNTKRPRSLDESMRLDSTERSDSFPELPLNDSLGDPVVDHDFGLIAPAAKPGKPNGNIPRASNTSTLPDFEDPVTPRAATEELGSSMFSLGFDLDTSGERVPSWSQAVSSASSVLHSWVGEPLRTLTRQLSRSRSGDADFEEDFPPPMPRPSLVSRNASFGRSTSDLLRQAIGSFGGSQRNLMASPSPVPTTPVDVGKTVVAQNVTGKDVLLDLARNKHHEGNQVFHNILNQACKGYRGKPLNNRIKEQLARGAVDWVLRNEGNFLKPDLDDNWTVISHADALEMAMRQVALDMDKYAPHLAVQLPRPPALSLPSRSVSFSSLFGGTPRTTFDDVFDLPPAKRAKVASSTPGIVSSFVRGAIDEGLRVLSQEGDIVLEKDITKTDILCGRGGKSNHHEGNKWYRDIIAQTRPKYHDDSLSKKEKTDISNGVVDFIQSHGGRFLKPEGSHEWVIMSHADARRKAAQLLRENKTLKWTL